MNPRQQFATIIKNGLNDFLNDNTDTQPQLIIHTQNKTKHTTQFLFSLKQYTDDAPETINPTKSYTIKDGGQTFTYGIQNDGYLTIETNLDTLDTIDTDKHIGEAIACIIHDFEDGHPPKHSPSSPFK